VSFIVYEVNWISMLSYLCLPAIWISALLFFYRMIIQTKATYVTKSLIALHQLQLLWIQVLWIVTLSKHGSYGHYFWQMIWNILHHFSSKDWWWFNLYDLHTYHVWFALDVVVLSILPVIYDCVPKLINSNYLFTYQQFLYCFIFFPHIASYYFCYTLYDLFIYSIRQRVNMTSYCDFVISFLFVATMIFSHYTPACIIILAV
jgi:hypothetical protein